MFITRLDPQYRFIYFNEMNLAVKSPLLSKRPPFVTIAPDAMKLLADVSAHTAVYMYS